MWEYVSIVRQFAQYKSGTTFYNGVQCQHLGSIDDNGFVAFLNKLGGDGWEIVSSDSQTTALGYWTKTYILKRKKEQK